MSPVMEKNVRHINTHSIMSLPLHFAITAFTKSSLKMGCHLLGCTLCRLQLIVCCSAVICTTVASQSPGVANSHIEWHSYYSGDPEPDTTSPWRYFPLAVGNAWEYKEHFFDTYYRREVVDTVQFNEEWYFELRYFVAENGGPMVPDPNPPVEYIRYDTTDAMVYAWSPKFNVEYHSFLAPCPFDAEYGSTPFCPGSGENAEVSGSLDGQLVFGGMEPGTGKDTVITAVKQYILGSAFVHRYGADFGQVYFESDGSLYGLYYSRVNGIEHGVPRYPTVNTEPQVPELNVRSWPNPVSEFMSLDLVGIGPGAVLYNVYDLMGRKVASGTVFAGNSAGTLVRLNFTSLTPGHYFIRLVGGRQKTAVIQFLKH